MSESLRTMIEKRRDAAKREYDECNEVLRMILPGDLDVHAKAVAAKPARKPSALAKAVAHIEKPAKRAVSEETRAKMRAAHAKRKADAESAHNQSMANGGG